MTSQEGSSEIQPYDKRHTLSPGAVAYMAGLIDGEASVACGPNKVSVQIGTTDLALLQWIQNHFGGTIYDLIPEAATLKWKRAWQIHFKPLEIRNLCKLCGPHLVSKKKRMYLLDKWLKGTFTGIRGSKGSKLLTKEKRHLREKIRAEVYRYNKRGHEESDFKIRLLREKTFPLAPNINPAKPARNHWAYLAGILDGEGSFTIAEQRDNRDGVSRQQLKIEIGNTNLPMLLWLQKHFAGRIAFHKWNQRKAIHLPSWVLSWGPSDYLKISEKVGKYLLTKREQNLTVQVWIKKTYLGPRRRLEIPAPVRMLRHSLREQMILLNAKGRTS